MPVESVPADKKKAALDHPEVDLYLKKIIGAIDPDIEDTLRGRLAEGSEKYGTSWNEVDLKTDLLEEIYDKINYLIFMAVRVAEVGGAPRGFLGRIHNMIEDTIGTIHTIQDFFPDFEGPTSNEWVKQQR